ncbi:hypothetical protein SBC2_10110 [Caballeronia sp. SBC2]|nr:hypothetical protein SBC2_10110 [Caballeronia sp. SBC2]
MVPNADTAWLFLRLTVTAFHWSTQDDGPLGQTKTVSIFLLIRTTLESARATRYLDVNFDCEPFQLDVIFVRYVGAILINEVDGRTHRDSDK